jgi:hypothetical protein
MEEEETVEAVEAEEAEVEGKVAVAVQVEVPTVKQVEEQVPRRAPRQRAPHTGDE